jgi:predicted small integral membrane protein
MAGGFAFCSSEHTWLSPHPAPSKKLLQIEVPPSGRLVISLNQALFIHVHFLEILMLF